MSHQVNYFLTPSDMQAVFERIKKAGPVLVLSWRSPSPSPLVVHEQDLMSETKWFSFHLVRPDDLPLVVCRHVPTQGYWVVDEQKSSVIEFGGCYFDDKILRRDRMYYTDGDYDANGTWVEKSDEFKKWAKAVFRAAKKGMTCLKHVYSGWYIGPEAQQWVETRGIKLVQM